MNELANEFDSLSLLFTSGVRAAVAFDKDLAHMRAEAALTKARITLATKDYQRHLANLASNPPSASMPLSRKDTLYGQGT